MEGGGKRSGGTCRSLKSAFCPSKPSRVYSFSDERCLIDACGEGVSGGRSASSLDAMPQALRSVALVAIAQARKPACLVLDGPLYATHLRRAAFSLCGEHLGGGSSLLIRAALWLFGVVKAWLAAARSPSEGIGLLVAELCYLKYSPFMQCDLAFIADSAHSLLLSSCCCL